MSQLTPEQQRNQRSNGHQVRIERSMCKLHGCKLDGYDMLVAPNLENELIEALCKS